MRVEDQIQAIAPAWEILEARSYQNPLTDALIVEAALRTSVSVVVMRSARHPSEVLDRLRIGALPDKVVRPFPFRPGRRRVRFK